jgi:ferrochelatase
LLAQALGLHEGQWAISFQSRFGRQEWVKPYTSELLQSWGEQGVGYVQVISPAFSADCLETLEELAVENKHLFIAAGGQRYDYIPALNSSPQHIALLASLVQPFVSAFHAVSTVKTAS